MTTLYLDWDGISYKEFRKIANHPTGKRSRGWMKNRLGHLSWTGIIERNSGAVWAWYRRSSGGRVHVRIEGNAILSKSQQIVLRVYLDDDHARIDMDITRWSKGEEINRLFDTKYKNGKTRHSGPWQYWFTYLG